MPTLASYYDELGRALGFYATGTATSGAAAATDLIDASLIDSDTESRFLDGVWFQLTSTHSGQALLGQVRRAKQGGLAPATGLVSMTRAFSSTTATGTTWRALGVLPPTDTLGRTGLLTCINRTLRECWFIDHLSVTGVNNQYQYSLSTAYPWLVNEEQIVDVWVRRSGAVRDQMVEEWRFINDMDGPQLEFKAPFTTSDTIKPVVYRPLDTWIGVNGTYADSTVGLAADSDTAVLPLDGLRIVGLQHAYQALATIGDESERADWRMLASQQRVAANQWKRAHLPREWGRDMHWRSSARSLVPAFPLEGSLS